MKQRLVIDCHELWEKVVGLPAGLRTVQRWLRLNGIDPVDVPLHSEMVIEDSAYGVLIRYQAYLTTEDGRHYVDPEHPDRAAVEDRTALLRLAPPADWLTVTGGER